MNTNTHTSDSNTRTTIQQCHTSATTYACELYFAGYPDLSCR